MPAEGVILSGILIKDRTGKYRELWRNPFGCRRCKAKAESLRQKDRAYSLTYVFKFRIFLRNFYFFYGRSILCWKSFRRLTPILQIMHCLFCLSERVSFLLSRDMLDQIEEVGLYSLAFKFKFTKFTIVFGF